LAPGPEWLAVTALALFALALHLSQIHQSLLGDEGFTYQDLAGHSLWSVITTVHTGGENSPPLFFVLSWLTSKLGDPTVWLRLPSIVLSAATVPVIYALARETVGRAAGLVASALYAVSPFLLFYGVEARPYATMMFFVAISTLAVVKAVATRSLWWWALYTAAAAAAAYSHYTCIFVLAAQGVWSLWAARDRLGQPLGANLAIAVLYLPWLPHVRGKALAVIGQLEPLNLHNVLDDLVRASTGYPYAYPHQIPTYAGLAVIGLCLGVGGFFLGRRQRRERGEATRSLWLLVALTLATPVGLYLYSTLATDLWLARGLSASLPAGAVLAGAVLAAPPRPLAVLVTAVTIAVLAIATITALEPRYERGPFRALAAYLDRTARPQDPVIYDTLVGPAVLDEQYRRPHAIVSGLAIAMQARAHALAHRRVFLVLDDTLARRWGNFTPVMPGLRFSARKHFDAVFPTDVVIYEPVASRR
jgi:mannosyltransferase